MNAYIIIIALAGLAVLIKVLCFTKAKPFFHTEQSIIDFPRFLASLMCNSMDGGHVYMTHEKSGNIIQFTKHGDETNGTLCFNYTFVPSKNTTFENIKNELHNRDINFNIEEAYSKDNSHESIEIAHIQSIENAVEISKYVISAMGIHSEDTFTIHFDYVPFFNVKATKANMKKYKKYLKPANK